jgi:hypothetical protein
VEIGFCAGPSPVKREGPPERGQMTSSLPALSRSPFRVVSWLQQAGVAAISWGKLHRAASHSVRQKSHANVD